MTEKEATSKGVKKDSPHACFIDHWAPCFIRALVLFLVGLVHEPVDKFVRYETSWRSLNGDSVHKPSGHPAHVSAADAVGHCWVLLVMAFGLSVSQLIRDHREFDFTLIFNETSPATSKRSVRIPKTSFS